MSLTKRQQEILLFIECFHGATGAPPTRADICNEFGFASPNAAECHLRALEKKGAIILHAARARGIQIPEVLT